MGTRGGVTLAVMLGALALAASAAGATLEPIGTATYDLPTHVASPPEDPDRLFVAEQPGTIDVTTPAGTLLFLDLTDKVLDGGERGLWSMAFAPDFPATRLFYVAYSANDGALTLDEYREQADPAATEATRRNVTSISSPASGAHNGGQLQFGPDGYLYWSTGEDTLAANAQDTGNLLGKILRIDPRGALPGQYTVPPDNPFVGAAGADEIWAYGLRNPWRFTFDRLTGEMYIGDVGAGSWEEVNRGGGGANYGWPTCEGACSSPSPGFTDPIYAYRSDDTPCNAVMGGYVVHDPDLGDLAGRYLFTDSCAGDLRSIDPSVPPLFDGHRSEGLTVDGPVSFGEDSCGRLYVVSQGLGQVFRLEGPSGGACPPPPPAADTAPPATKLRLRALNPRGSRVRAGFSSSEPGSSFECRRDRRPWKACTSPKRLIALDPGRHRFRVRATDSAGNTDPTPAKGRIRTYFKKPS